VSTDPQPEYFQSATVLIFDKTNVNNNLNDENGEKILILIIIARLHSILREIQSYVKNIFRLF